MHLKNKNILFINTGGGLGDALNCLPIINCINKYFKPKDLYYYSVDLNNYWFETKLKEFKPKIFTTVKSFPNYFGFRDFHKKISQNLINKFKFDQFDLIIDNQTRFKTALIYKKIPHRYYITPCLNYTLSNPLYFMAQNKNFNLRIFNYLSKVLSKRIRPNYNLKIPKEFMSAANKLMPNNKRYIGFSLTVGHPTRKKEFNIDEIIKVANFYSKNFIPTFFIEKKYEKLKKIIKKKVPKSFFPEEKISTKYQKPMIVTALGSLTKFNISVDNGISHMLSFSGVKNYIFYSENSEKFKPINKNSIVYDCKKNNKKIDELKAEEIIEFLKKY